jgi:hypothetical protein
MTQRGLEYQGEGDRWVILASNDNHSLPFRACSCYLLPAEQVAWGRVGKAWRPQEDDLGNMIRIRNGESLNCFELVSEPELFACVSRMKTRQRAFSLTAQPANRKAT